jgi:hypothetical protein
MNALRWLSLTLLLVLVSGASAVPTSVTDLPQLTAEAPLRVPMTKSCTETVLTHLFTNSYGSPGYGQHKATACPGPWSYVSLGVEVSVSGVQFDRMFDIYIGNVPLLSSSTSEPASEVPGAITHWHVDSDASRFAGLLASDQPITAILNNVNDSTYTGQYQVTLTLTYYATSSDAPAITPPDYMAAVFVPDGSKTFAAPGNTGDSGYSPLRVGTLTYQRDLTLPTNLINLVADVYAQGHGACEEFWWAEPGQCGTGTPLRQAVLSVDGVIAGFAPVYPTLFTGGGGPGSWNPIPSPRAWHVDPYRLDLTPFIGLLVDGKPHTFKISVPDAAYSDPGDYWEVGAALLGGVDPKLSQTSGALTSMPVAADATESSMSDPVVGATVFTGSRSGSWAGYVVGSDGRVDTAVSNNYDISSQSAAAVNSSWNWTTISKVTPAGGSATTTTVKRSYLLRSPGVGGGQFGDTTTISVDGATPFQSSTDIQLTTAGAVYVNLTQAETYKASNSTGYCYSRVVNASSGYIVADTLDPTCSTAGTGYGNGPASPFGSGSDRGTGGKLGTGAPTTSGTTDTTGNTTTTPVAVIETPASSMVTTTTSAPMPEGRYGGGVLGLPLLVSLLLSWRVRKSRPRRLFAVRR